MNGIDNVNLFNGTLTVTIPIGQRYHVNGNLQYGLTLVYTGNLWDGVHPPTTAPMTYPFRRANAGLGWLLSLGRLFPDNQFPTQESLNWSYESPDGALHNFPCSGLNGTNPGCTAGPYYSTDGSYLRLVVNNSSRTVEFPDGTSQVFENKRTNGSWTPPTSTGDWRLTAINDRFGNSVTIGYSSADATSTTPAYPEIWTITEGTRTQKVYFIAPPAQSSTVPNAYLLALDHVVLTTFGSQTSTWQTSYDNKVITPGTHDGHTGSVSPVYVPLLTSVTLPKVGETSQVYSMLGPGPDGTAYYNIGTTNADLINGSLMGMQLPTKGWIEWGYENKAFDIATSTSRSLMVTTRKTLTPDRSSTNTWTYARQASNNRHCPDSTGNSIFFPADQLVVEVTSPENVTSVHYFSLYQENTVPCSDSTTISFNPVYYGMPFTLGVPDDPATPQRYLSQETYTGTPPLVTSSTNYRVTGGTRKRSEWAYYRFDMPEVETAYSPESAHTTKYEDDGDCGSGTCSYSSVTHYNPDGAGHYRQSSTSGNFSSGNFSTSFTNYTGVNRTTGPWLLNRFTEQCKVEENVFRGQIASPVNCGALATAPTNGSNLSGPFVRQFCFNANGFLTRQRSLAGPSAGAHDLLAVFSPQDGNVGQEDYYGGDAQSLGTGSICDVTLPTASEYEMKHIYSSGTLATSYHSPNTTPITYDVNNTIDPSTGLISQSTDPAGLSTSYVYDALGRLSSITRPGEAVVTATYTEATSSAGGKVVVEQDSTAGTLKSTTIFDGFGRIAEEQQLMPTGTAKRQTTYNGSGWTTGVSQWEGAPSHFTIFSNFDAFGRAQTITAPDQTSVTATQVAYTGTRQVVRSVSVGTSLSNGTVSQQLEDTTEVYDRAGRLVKVTEPGGDSQTTYGYDAADHLTSVSMTDGTTTQSRTFSYDGRGLLLSEQHPENGLTTYASYDSRGHAGRKLAGSFYSPYDLKYQYDTFERLTDVYQLLNRINLQANPPETDQKQVVRHFTFATANDGTNHKQGKLETATRTNYLPGSLGTTDVKETYTYADSAGRLTNKVTEVIAPGGLTQQKYQQSYAYNDAGLFSTINYPTCPDPAHPCATPSSMISSISPIYANGLLSGISNFTSGNGIAYDLNGMVSEVDHPGGVNDLITVDANKLTRPTSIKFNYYDLCSRPQISPDLADKQVSSGSPAGLQISASGTSPLTYEWFKDGSTTPMPGETGSSCCGGVLTSSATFKVSVINSCGKIDSRVATVTVCGNPTVSVSPGSATYTGSPITLTAVANACGPWTYQWYIGDSGNTGSPVGTNSSSFTVSGLQSTTHYWVRVTDAYGATGNSNTVIVTVAAPLPTPGPLTASFNPSTGLVMVGWGASSGADHYELQRLDHGSWTTSSVYATSISYSFTGGTTYVFNVRAVDSSGGRPSSYTANDLATTIAFTTLQSGVTKVAFDHFEQIRTAINAVRLAHNDAALSWRQMLDLAGYTTVPEAALNVRIYAAHILALRAAMDAALNNVQVATAGYTDSLTSPTPIRATHITQLQQRAQ
jgi:YD repeat-containing protein